GYGGPQPPAGSGDHTYSIAVYAVDVASLDIEDKPAAADLRRALDGHVLASGTLDGVVGR
ncbi:MAG TPA: YbhB/YbcL family Raf kinase inhibitor-like protein, partial [Coriobacteriia bacterium]|nr:YbhB/YbcL family Raf kinase inhibitor-like protein [Coriobacteriia bacterium]